jgi:hypothetical protein
MFKHHSLIYLTLFICASIFNLISDVFGEAIAFKTIPIYKGPVFFPLSPKYRFDENLLKEDIKKAREALSTPTNSHLLGIAPDVPTSGRADLNMNGIQVTVHFSLVNLTGWIDPPEKLLVVGGHAQEEPETIRPEVISSKEFIAVNSSQAKNDSTADSTLLGLRIQVDIASHLPETKDGNSYALRIHENRLTARNQCDNLGKHFNPYNADGTGCYSNESKGKECACKVGVPITQCEAGNLSDKWGTIPASTDLKRRRDTIVWYDPSLSVTGLNNVLNRSVALYEPGNSIAACATIFALDRNGLPMGADPDSGTSDARSTYQTRSTLNTLISALVVVSVALSTLYT